MRPFLSLSLSQKLFACIFLLTAVVLVATLALALARWSFDRGFLDYVNALDKRRLDRIAVDLIDYYESQGSTWVGLAQEDFAALLERHAPRGRMQRGGRQAPPKSPKASDTDSGSGSRALSDNNDPGALPDALARRLGPPTALFDAKGRMLAGRRFVSEPDRLLSVPIVQAGEIIGELRANVLRRVVQSEDSEFLRQQNQRSFLIGSGALALAALVSWLLSRTLLKPIRRSLRNVARLSSGDYEKPSDTSTAQEHNDELGRLAHDLEHLRATLAENRTARRRLLADVSHELRTPLTILGGEMAAIRDGLRPMNQTSLASLDEEIERLKRLVNDLYELSVSDVGGLHYEFTAMDLVDCVDGALRAFQHSIKQSGLVIERLVKGPAHLTADKRRLEQLVTNLLANSIAYTDAPGKVRLTIEIDVNEVRLDVEDSPPAVKEGHYKHLFESLYREDASRSRRTGGAGLGLAICRNIVEAHHGSIEASKSALGGLCVSVTLPVNR